MRILSSKNIVGVLAAAFLVMSLSACDQQGPAEELGEKVDETLNDASRAIEDAAD